MSSCGQHRRELAGGVRLTTNNRMELLAVIVALRSLKYRSAATIVQPTPVNDPWRDERQRSPVARLGPKGPAGAENADLWQQLLELCAVHEVTLCWVKRMWRCGERCCDQLSEHVPLAEDLPADDGYEVPVANAGLFRAAAVAVALIALGEILLQVVHNSGPSRNRRLLCRGGKFPNLPISSGHNRQVGKWI